MSITLTPEQQQALDAQPNHPLKLVDPRTNAAFVLVRIEEFENIREKLEDEAFQKSVAAMALKNAAKWAKENLY